MEILEPQPSDYLDGMYTLMYLDWCTTRRRIFCTIHERYYFFLFMSVFFFSLFHRSVAIIKSNKDTRYGLDSIVTHDGMKLPCWALPNLSSFKQKFGQGAYDKVSLSPFICYVNVLKLFGSWINVSSIMKSSEFSVTIVIELPSFPGWQNG